LGSQWQLDAFNGSGRREANKKNAKLKPVLECLPSVVALRYAAALLPDMARANNFSTKF